MAKNRALYLGLWGGLVLVVGLAVGFQLQNLAWSTARVKNESPQTLLEVIVLVNYAPVRVGEISAGRSRFVRLPKRGNAILSVEFSALGRKHKGCTAYVEGERFHVRVTISPSLAVSCRTEVGVLTSRFLLLELL